MAKLLRSLSETLHKLPKAEFNAICIKISHTPLKTKEQRSFNSLKIKYFIDNSNYVEAKDILLNFIKNSKNTKIDIKLYYCLYLAFDGLKEIKNSKKYLEKCLKINKKNYVVLNNLANIFRPPLQTSLSIQLHHMNLFHLYNLVGQLLHCDLSQQYSFDC